MKSFVYYARGRIGSTTKEKKEGLTSTTTKELSSVEKFTTTEKKDKKNSIKDASTIIFTIHTTTNCHQEWQQRMPHVDKRKEHFLMREMLQQRIVSATKTKKDDSSGIMTSKEERMLLRDMTRDVS